MLIVTQDEKMIINVDNVATIYIGNGKCFADVVAVLPVIYPVAYTNGERWVEKLGRYSSVERAKAVLKEFWKAKWEAWEVFEMPLDDGKPRSCENCENDKCPYAQLEDKYKPRECYYHEVNISF